MTCFLQYLLNRVELSTATSLSLFLFYPRQRRSRMVGTHRPGTHHVPDCTLYPALRSGPTPLNQHHTQLITSQKGGPFHQNNEHPVSRCHLKKKKKRTLTNTRSKAEMASNDNTDTVENGSEGLRHKTWRNTAFDLRGKKQRLGLGGELLSEGRKLTLL